MLMSSRNKEPSFLDKAKGVVASGATITALPLAAAIPETISYVGNDYNKIKTPSPLYNELKRMFLSENRFGDSRGMADRVTGTKPKSLARFLQSLNENNRPHTSLTGDIHNTGELGNFNPGVLAHEMGHAQRLQSTSGSDLFKRIKFVVKHRGAGNVGRNIAPLLPLVFAGTGENTQNVAALGTSALLATRIPEEIRASRIGSKLLHEAAKNTGTKLSLLKRLTPYKGLSSYGLAAAAPLLGLQAYRHFTKKSSLNNRYYEGEGISGYMNPWNVANPKRLYFNRDNAANLGIVAGTGLAGRVIGDWGGRSIGRSIGKHNVAAMKTKMPVSRITFSPARPMFENSVTTKPVTVTKGGITASMAPKLKRGDRFIRRISRIGGSRGRMIGTGVGLLGGYLALNRKERKPSILDFNNWIKR